MNRLSSLALLSLLSATPTFGQATTQPADPFARLRNKEVLFNGWGISPAGKHAQVGSMPLKMAVAPDGGCIVSTSAGAAPGISVVNPETMQTINNFALPRCFNGLAFSRDGKNIFVTGGNSSLIHVFTYGGAGKVEFLKSVSLDPEAVPERRRGAAGTDNFLMGVTVSPTTGDLYVCSEGSNEVWVVDAEKLLASKPEGEEGLVKAKFRTGERPYQCVFGADKRHVYVSNWADRSLSVIDAKNARVVSTANVGIRPNDMVVSPDGRLFVACAGDNTVHVLQTRSLQAGPRATDQSAPPDESALEVISTSIYPQSPEGSTPVGVAVSPDGKRLYVANADNNDVMVADISDPKLTDVLGFVPTGWYPTAITAYKDQIVTGVGKGLASRENWPPKLPNNNANPKMRFDGEYRIYEGYDSFVGPVNAEQMAAFTKQVRANSPYQPSTLRKPLVAPADSPIPPRVGGESPIKHIVYVIKENRTYDQVFGDMRDAAGKPLGNGEPKLTLFGEAVTTNQHELARQYVLFDNLYVNSEVSVDGHSWCDAAIATDANVKGWVTSYTGHGHMPEGKDLSAPAGGYLWDACKRAGLSFKNYGEGAANVATANRGTWSTGRDPEKVDAFLKDLAKAEKTGDFPAFNIMSLGENHTKGTTPGAHTPAACVASNDVAIGKLIEGLSKSKFWQETAVFIIEDDAQNGPDHVDSHRTCGLVISPWVKRNYVDSTHYTQVSMVRTMELILGLAPMTQYDAGATPMYNAFMNKPEVAVYSPKTPEVDLAAVNTVNSPGAKRSAMMNFDEYDDAPEDELNRILWEAVKGKSVPFPAPKRSAMSMPG